MNGAPSPEAPSALPGIPPESENLAFRRSQVNDSLGYDRRVEAQWVGSKGDPPGLLQREAHGIFVVEGSMLRVELVGGPVRMGC